MGQSNNDLYNQWFDPEMTISVGLLVTQLLDPCLLVGAHDMEDCPGLFNSTGLGTAQLRWRRRRRKRFRFASREFNA